MSQHYFVKLVPPRPSFAQDASDLERQMIEQHSVYWRQLLGQGRVIVFGPVFDPAGVFGIGVVQAETDEALKQWLDNDPAAGIMSYQFYPMQAVTAA